MAQSLRLSEKWFRRGLWVVAFLFGSFLTGLGGALVSDLPRVEVRVQQDQFMDPAATAAARAELKRANLARDEARDALDQARLAHTRAQADSQTARETFNHWLATRRATARAEQDPELLRRTTELDGLKALERQALAQVEQQQQAELDARQAASRAQASLSALQNGAQEALQKAQRAQELRVFLYRLALTLPLLAVAAWLFAKQRQSRWWPFVWGFIGFAVVAFFVELVPYLPSYGGYVRYGVGILLTALLGRQGILALQRYLDAQQQAEAQPDLRRRDVLDYDLALARLAKGVCPGCERPVDLKNTAIDFCPHCGMGLHDRCGACQTRKSAFSKYCHSCGSPARANEGPAAAGGPPASGKGTGLGAALAAPPASPEPSP